MSELAVLVALIFVVIGIANIAVLLVAAHRGRKP